MPAEIVSAICCASLFGVYKMPSDSDPSVTYECLLNGAEGGPYCPCKAWKFSAEEVYDRHCKHLDRVWKGICGWNPQWESGKEKPALQPESYTYAAFTDEPCPACGGKTVAIKIAI